MSKSFASRRWKTGLSDAEYVEVVGITSRVANLDIVARGIDVPLRAIGAVRSGDPTRRRPQKATAEGAWIDTVPSGIRGGDDARELYGNAMMPFIIRALSLVLGESIAHLELEQAQYLPLQNFGQFDYQHHEGLTRPQVEVVSGRVSAINECFY